MTFVIVKTADNKLHTTKTYADYVGAARAIARFVKKNEALNVTYADFAIVEAAKYVKPKVERVNLMTGKTFLEDYDTPYYCSPSSETYWSM